MTGGKQNFSARGENFGARGEDLKASGEDFSARGEDLRASGEDFSARGEDLRASGEDFSARGEDLSTRGEDLVCERLVSGRQLTPTPPVKHFLKKKKVILFFIKLIPLVLRFKFFNKFKINDHASSCKSFS